MKTAVLKIQGMHCQGCAHTIGALLSGEPGVHETEVSFEEREARIRFDPRAITEDELVASIRRAGFTVAERSSWTISGS